MRDSVGVDDARYFANFGQLLFDNKDVMAPFWIDTQWTISHTGGVFRKGLSLLVPVSHAELELHIRAPKPGVGINADVSYFFGIDGKSEWRTMDELDQAWVLKRKAHRYEGSLALEVIRLTDRLTVAYLHQHVRRPQLPFGGYYTLGVCQDGVAVVEQKMTGKVTLFPNTVDAFLFDDPRDAEVKALFGKIPDDTTGSRPDLERVFGALPTTDFDSITIPGLGADLKETFTAWRKGELE